MRTIRTSSRARHIGVDLRYLQWIPPIGYLGIAGGGSLGFPVGPWARRRPDLIAVTEVWHSAFSHGARIFGLRKGVWSSEWEPRPLSSLYFAYLGDFQGGSLALSIS
ncbi:hypothetical protein AVEN_61077-1 [Araneus ventricosus]|uniref:Uncharacterized protein n=1 Tax=Araneus ventricosus TaxID=182803 RepID=A0A4Y2PZ77_ARAVE|nr:hypothetical protein AVEN_61077-1 [Araneus ventricosus]